LPWAHPAWKFAKRLAEWCPLTLRALLAGVLLAWLLKAVAEPRQDQILLAVSIGGLALIGLITLLALTAAVWVKLRRQPPAEGALVFEARTAMPTGYTLGRLHWLPLLNFEVAWEKPEGVEVRLVPGRGGLCEEVTASERALGPEIMRKIRVSYVFGLARFAVRRRLEQAIAIKPDRGKVPPLSLVNQNVIGDQTLG
jgi:hypothetical protein